MPPGDQLLGRGIDPLRLKSGLCRLQSGYLGSQFIRGRASAYLSSWVGAGMGRENACFFLGSGVILLEFQTSYFRGVGLPQFSLHIADHCSCIKFFPLKGQTVWPIVQPPDPQPWFFGKMGRVGWVLH